MTAENRNVGLVSYAEAARSPARAVLAKLEIKCRLRAELLAVQSELDAMVPALSSADLAELQAAMVQAVDTADSDVAALAKQVEAERKLAATVNPQVVRISRKTTKTLAEQAEKMVAAGHYPSTSSMIDRAVDLLWGEHF
jgi:hypothetical protein